MASSPDRADPLENLAHGPDGELIETDYNRLTEFDHVDTETLRTRTSQSGIDGCDKMSRGQLIDAMQRR